MLRSPGTTSCFGCGERSGAPAASRTSAPSTSSSSVVVQAPMKSPSSGSPAIWLTPTTLSGENGFATCGSSLSSATG